MKIEQKTLKIPELKIGDGKLKKRFKINWKFKNIKDWFISITIRW